MTFAKEADFEKALVNLLPSKGWDPQVIKYPTEEDLIKNWAQILFENNREQDRLNDCPLTDSEMQQILEKITELRTPLRLNGFINGKTTEIIRDNPDDKLHYGKPVTLKIYDRQEIAAGQSRYQIAQQPKFEGMSPLSKDRRGDVTLLINGMPLIHVELKRGGADTCRTAAGQIETYSKEHIFTGLFSLVQIFVAMDPDETVYFANPGPDGQFLEPFRFHWANFNNEPVNQWMEVVDSLLSIPMAHQLIGFYTVADETDGILKVMRSYQYYAASGIATAVTKIPKGTLNPKGGYIWHTTGSGKTMTSFKSAQLIAASGTADKVLFLMDRIELGNQSHLNYLGFSGESKSVQKEQRSVQKSENTFHLIALLKNDKDKLIVTSIQKLSNIYEHGTKTIAADIESINQKRIVIIVDECHRSTFGDMLVAIKKTFPYAIFFGFTGTPIHEENKKKENTTTSIFGNELHRYSIADGIRDKNVLGFDPYQVKTYEDDDVRLAVALDEAKAKSVEDALADKLKKTVYHRFMDSGQVKMAGYMGEDGKYVKGIEDYLPRTQYECAEHRNMVGQDIMKHWKTLSQANKFHSIFATSSIPEAIDYYRLLKERMPSLKVTALFDSSDYTGEAAYDKEMALMEILGDYNKLFDKNFDIPHWQSFKDDVALRLAHKVPYKNLSSDQQLNLLIVVDQMLTGYDSKWLNTLYMDKLLTYENIIQAFSRTNRLFDNEQEKQYGIIRYYRKPHTMRQNIDKAVALYSGNKPLGLFVDKLPKNLERMCKVYEEIKELFNEAGIEDFSKLPDDSAIQRKFVSLFNKLSLIVSSAKLQGFSWDKTVYQFEDMTISIPFSEEIYLTLLQRYKELASGGGGEGGGDAPFDLSGYLTSLDTGKIDSDYMNSKFQKFLKQLNDSKETEAVLSELYKTFAMLSQKEQVFAHAFLSDVLSGNITPEEGKAFRDYINEYQARANDDLIHKVAGTLGLDEKMLRGLKGLRITEKNINEYGRLDKLKATVDTQKTKVFFEQKNDGPLPVFKVNMQLDKFLRDFLINGVADL